MAILKATSDNLLLASRIIKRGGLVVYPTDTLYGLGCDPFNIKAVRRLINAKGERNKPLPILASDITFVSNIAHISESTRNIASKVWPGPFTLVIPKKNILPSIVTSNLDSVGVRIPRHDIAIQLIRLSGGLLVGTSANKTGKKPPKTAFEAAKQLNEDVDVILDGGSTFLHVPSAVVDLTSSIPKLLREGPVCLEEVLENYLSK